MDEKPYVKHEVIDLDTIEDRAEIKGKQEAPSLSSSAFKVIKIDPDSALPITDSNHNGNNIIVIKIEDDEDSNSSDLGKEEDVNVLIHHSTWHTGEKPYKCSDCNFRTLLKVNLRKHALIHRKIIKRDPDMVQLKCNDCNYRTCIRRNLCRHVKVHRRCNMCEKCKYKARSVSRLKQHMVCHEENRIKRYRCDVCKNRYLRKSSLLKHMKMRPCNRQNVRVIEDGLIL